MVIITITILLVTIYTTTLPVKAQSRARDHGIKIGILKPGSYNAITDVQGVLVGHATIIRDSTVRTGVTVIKPHNGNRS